MAFLFKSKKNAEKAQAQATKDGAGSQSSFQSSNGRLNDKSAVQQSSTPSSSVSNSITSLQGAGSAAATPSPEQINNGRRGPATEPAQNLPLRNASAPAAPPQSMNSNPNASLYPWSMRRLTYTTSHPSPFPRYGAAVNSVASKEGDIYLMGGLINSSTVKGDLWMVEAGGNMACYPLATTAEGPGPRVGHASLLVGNAFIVYGGDTKMEDSDVLDETLYLLNTSTRQWSRAVPAGPRPSGRYGHSLNILGSKIYVFGGQVEGYFMNDLVAFDLNQLQIPSNRWEMLIRNSDEGGPPQGQIPPARTNHSVVTYNEKLYLFGGTNGLQWFNDVWCYDPVTNAWAVLDCIGYIPAPREGHAAAIVDDVMYIFGGRTEEGADLGDLAAFRISSRRWYTFQNMGPSPSPRSGHSMTAAGKQIVVLAGEPSTAMREAADLVIVYLLDTSKIRYPNDQHIQQVQERIPGQRRPSGTDKTGMGATRGPSRDGSVGSESRRLNGCLPRESVMAGTGAGRGPGQPGVNGNDMNGVAPGSAQPQGAPSNGNQVAPSGPPVSMQNGQQNGSPGGSKLPRANAPSGPPPQQQAPRPNGSPMGNVRGKPPIQGPPGPQPPRGPPQTNSERSLSPPVDTSIRNPALDSIVSPQGTTRDMSPGRTLSPILQESPTSQTPERESPITNGRRTPTQAQQATKPVSLENALPVSMNPGPTSRSSSNPRQARQQASIDSISEQSSLRNVTNSRTNSPPPPSRQPSNPLSRKGSSRNSQTVNILKELDMAKNRNAWYASELELARKAGYKPNPSNSPMLDLRAAESFDDDDKPLIEALIAMKTELTNVQTSIDKQAVLAARQIAEVEKQRDAAVAEAFYAKAKLAAHGGSQSSTPQLDNESRDLGFMSSDRSTDIGRRLAAALAEQCVLRNLVQMLTSEVESEKRSRKLAEDISGSTQSRMAELETYRQQNSSEVERLKAELHELQISNREEAIICSEAIAAAQSLQFDKDVLESKYQEARTLTQDHSSTFESLREAIASAAEMRLLLERKLNEERTQREQVDSKLLQIKSEYETRTTELDTATRRLRDAEEIAEQHAAEARTHREAVLAGLDKVATRDLSAVPSGEINRAAALQAQIQAANAMVRKYQAAADIASEKLRSAEARIAGLEAYQEQSSRESMSIRKQLQANMREVQTLQAANSELNAKLSNQQLETNAVHVQHNTLKDLLGERGISPSGAGAARARALSSPQSDRNTPDIFRLRDLEQQLAASVHSHQETRQTFDAQQQETEGAYREKLSQLENDYQSAVHYVKGTEKMLKRMKDELAKYKTDNVRLKEQLADTEERRAIPSGWESERAALTQQIESLQTEMKSSATQMEHQIVELRRELATTQQERDHHMRNHEQAQRQLTTHSEQSRSDLAQLQQENSSLERRALDAEQKVSLLLDQVEHSVDNYRRQSRQVESVVIPVSTHQRNLSATNSVSESSLYEGGNRNSTALDSLATELETLRSHWQNTNKSYRLSNAFDFEDTPSSRGADEGLGAANTEDGLSGSLADWRKRLDQDEEAERSRNGSISAAMSPISSTSGGKREMSPIEVGSGALNKAQVNLI